MVKVAGPLTPYSTIMPLLGNQELQSWVPAEDVERISAYFKYDDIYWNMPETFKLQKRGDDSAPIYIPNPRTVVDTTAYYLLKGLQLTIENEEKHRPLRDALRTLLRREKFYSKFHVAKHAGVARGDFVFHITADPDAPDGEKISISSVLPHNYFPVRDPDDDTKIIKVHLADEFTNEQGRSVVKRLTYEYVKVGKTRQVQRTEGIFEVKDWFDPKKSKQIQQTLKRELLPPQVTNIPVYHFPNMQWDGEHFGSSEIKGMERLFGAVNQTISDEEMALALEGLGVYATDAAGPVDDDGNDLDWEIAPARVMEVPAGSSFKRVEGVGSVKPMLDHIGYLDEKLFEATGTSDVARGKVDVQTAESGIALAIKFIPQLAKTEERDVQGVETLYLMFQDWKFWHDAYENEDFGDVDIIPILGEKLPLNRTSILNELNNMLDRKVISKKFYRQVMAAKLDYEFPDDIEQQILDEQKAQLELMQNQMNGGNPGNQGTQDAPPTSGGDPRTTKKGSTAPAPGNQSNNTSRPNESGGTEATQSASKQSGA
jgi:hypothetical protein